MDTLSAILMSIISLIIFGIPGGIILLICLGFWERAKTKRLRAEDARWAAGLVAAHDRMARLRQELPPFLHAYCTLLTTIDISGLPSTYRRRLSAIKEDILICIGFIWSDPKRPVSERRAWERKSERELLMDATFSAENLKVVTDRRLQALFEKMVSVSVNEDDDRDKPAFTLENFNGAMAATWLAGLEWAVSDFLHEKQLKNIEREQHLIYGQSNTTEYPYPLLTVAQADRFSHAYLIGKTGSGKSTFLKNLIAQDIRNNHAVIVLASENDLFRAILPHVTAERVDDLIYFDPADTLTPIVAWNPFDFSEADNLPAHTRAEYLTLRAGETITAFERALGDLGVRMRPLVSNAVYALLEYPHTTIADFNRLLDPHDASFRRALLSSPQIQDQTKRFWEQFDKDKQYTSAAPAVINRLDPFFRPPLTEVLARSSFSFHEVIDGERPRLFFINLSRLRGDHARIIGQLLIAAIQQTILRRDSIPEAERRPTFMYIDEFALYAGTSEQSFVDLFARARKYKVGLTIAHQTTDDIPAALLGIITGNVGTVTALQLAAGDAPYFARELQIKDREGHARPDWLQNLKRGEACTKTPQQHTGVFTTMPFALVDPDLIHTLPSYIDQLITASKANYGLHVEPRAPEAGPEPLDAGTVDDNDLDDVLDF